MTNIEQRFKDMEAKFKKFDEMSSRLDEFQSRLDSADICPKCGENLTSEVSLAYSKFTSNCTSCDFQSSITIQELVEMCRSRK